MGTVANNLRRLKQEIESAAARAGRYPQDLVLVAVSKKMPVEVISEAIQAGQFDFGENRIQEAKAKIPLVSNPVRWHMIGHLQRNKAKDAVRLFDLIQSVDSMALAREINHRAEELGKIQDILLQVNTSGEAQKSGCTVAELTGLAEGLEDLTSVRLQGLMTIGPLTANEKGIRASFRSLKTAFDQLAGTDRGADRMKYLSMGMSGDFAIALEEGANMLRIGTAIFGPRTEKP